MRAVSLGGVTFDNPLFIKEEFNLKDVKGKAFNTLNGGIIVYETPKRNNANYVTLESKMSGWINEITLNKIVTLLDDLDVVVDLTFEDNSSVKVRPALEKGNVVIAENLINENSGWYSVTINLCRV